MAKDAKTLEKKPYQLFNLPWYFFAIFAVVVLAAAYLGVLPTGMAGCCAFMIVLGTILNEIGDHTPIISAAVPSLSSSAPRCWTTSICCPTC